MSYDGNAGEGFLINKKLKDHTVRVNSISLTVAKLALCVARRYKLKIV